jgi:hypothetical protein
MADVGCVLLPLHSSISHHAPLKAAAGGGTQRRGLMQDFERLKPVDIEAR